MHKIFNKMYTHPKKKDSSNVEVQVLCEGLQALTATQSCGLYWGQICASGE